MLAHLGSHAIRNAIWSYVVARIRHSTFQNVAPPTISVSEFSMN